MRLKNEAKRILFETGRNMRQISKETGLMYATVHKALSGDIIPGSTRVETLRKIARALNVKIDDLFTESDE